ncbi:hypothetical protein HYY71_03905 [Candidatus Woesearchaeota archaeon]|nr:hypothetical protein [Candidatus Woesearchaeota archaeon]
MKKTTIWVFAMFLLFIPLAYSAPISVARFNNIIGNITLYATNDVNCTDDNSTYNIAGLAAGTLTQEPNIGVQGACLYSNDDRVQWSGRHFDNITNQTALIWINYSTSNFASPEAFLFKGTGTSMGAGGVRIMKDNNENTIIFTYSQAGGAETGASGSSPAFFSSADYVLLGISINVTNMANRADIYGFLNETVIATASPTFASVTGNDSVNFGGRQGDDMLVVNAHMGEILWINMTLTTDDMANITKTFFNNQHLIKIAQADTTPPSITYFNLTNGNGCDVWNTDKNIACNTTMGTPTVQFNTNEDAWCAIIGNSSSTLGKNYTEMGSSKSCTGAQAGEGTASHLCTLRSEDELIFESSYIYISCKDASDNQNISGISTSGPLNVSVTAEANARDSIEQGIRNALLSSYTTYTDQRIYARNSANTQATGKFDKVVKKLGKIWAFNRIGHSESHVNMFNITPVLYTLEFSNRTTAYIENQTTLLINATK